MLLTTLVYHMACSMASYLSDVLMISSMTLLMDCTEVNSLPVHAFNHFCRMIISVKDSLAHGHPSFSKKAQVLDRI